jgi:hypothetical protein
VPDVVEDDIACAGNALLRACAELALGKDPVELTPGDRNRARHGIQWREGLLGAEHLLGDRASEHVVGQLQGSITRHARAVRGDVAQREPADVRTAIEDRQRRSGEAAHPQSLAKPRARTGSGARRPHARG